MDSLAGDKGEESQSSYNNLSALLYMEGGYEVAEKKEGGKRTQGLGE